MLLRMQFLGKLFSKYLKIRLSDKSEPITLEWSQRTHFAADFYHTVTEYVGGVVEYMTDS